MAETTFNTTAGQTIARELLVAYLNVADTAASPEWAPLGMRVESSSMEYDMSKETMQDIMGATYTTLKKPVITQSFDPLPLDAKDDAAKKIWDMGIHDQDAQALANQDMLVVHMYAGTRDTAAFAERYSNCAISVTSLGGDGGGVLTMGTEITFGGTRTVGTAATSDGDVTFTAGS